MSGLMYLVGAVFMAALGLAILWIVEKAPFRDSLEGVDEFERARTALKMRERTHLARGEAASQAGMKSKATEQRVGGSSTVRVLR